MTKPKLGQNKNDNEPKHTFRMNLNFATLWAKIGSAMSSSREAQVR